LTVHHGMACLAVRDSGIGIPADHLQHIFERFYRVDKTRSRAEGGSGLGLSIAQWITQAHGGTLAAESVVGNGSDFRVTLPTAALADQIVPTVLPATPAVSR
jgi:signal transduction histidine kinase